MPTTQVGSHLVYHDDLGAGHPLLLIPGLGVKNGTLVQKQLIIITSPVDVVKKKIWATGFPIHLREYSRRCFICSWSRLLISNDNR